VEGSARAGARPRPQSPAGRWAGTTGSTAGWSTGPTWSARTTRTTRTSRATERAAAGQT